MVLLYKAIKRLPHLSHAFPQILNICLLMLFHDQVWSSSVRKTWGQEVKGEDP